MPNRNPRRTPQHRPVLLRSLPDPLGSHQHCRSENKYAHGLPALQHRSFDSNLVSYIALGHREGSGRDKASRQPKIKLRSTPRW